MTVPFWTTQARLCRNSEIRSPSPRPGAFLAHQRGEVGGIESVAAQDPMTTEEPPPPTLPTK